MSWKHQEISEKAEAWAYEFRSDRVIVVTLEWDSALHRAQEPVRPTRRHAPTIRDLGGMRPATQDFEGEIVGIPVLVRKFVQEKAAVHGFDTPAADFYPDA